MKFRILSLLAAMCVAGGFLTIKPAAEPVDVFEQEAAKAQKQIQRFEARIAAKEKKIGQLVNSAEWQAINNEWLALKDQFEAVKDLAAQRIDIAQQVFRRKLTKAQAQNKMSDIFERMNAVMPHDQDISALSDRIENFGKERRGPQPLLRREEQPEVVQHKPVPAPRTAIVTDKQKLEKDLQKLEASLRKYKDDFQKYKSEFDKYSSYLPASTVSALYGAVNEINRAAVPISNVTMELREALNKNDQVKIAEIAPLMENYQKLIEQIHGRLNNVHTMIIEQLKKIGVLG